MRSIIVAGLVIAGCKQDRVARPPRSMADLIPPSARTHVEPGPVPLAPAVARMQAAARVTEGRADSQQLRAELRTSLGAPSLELDGWIEWAIVDGDECESVWIERAGAPEVDHHRFSDIDGADLDACRALAAGDPHARIIDAVAMAHSDFETPADARAWLRRNLGAPSRELTPSDDHKTVWALTVGGACFTIAIDDATFDRRIAGAGYPEIDPTYADCKRWSEGRGG